MKRYFFRYTLSFYALHILVACTGASSGTNGTNGNNTVVCAVQADQPSTATYTISWNPVTLTEGTLDGYNIYYSVTAPLSKANAMGFVPISAATTNLIFVPADFDITTCTTIYIAITSIGSKPESSLSTVQTLIVE